ncbi:MAG: DNA-3-methyladenine glycosylase 2 family protein [Gammaproteobacteria bacterium]|nr:DNA-3-methyladenine glycosylase 2 family protein [Gammaproteobacteria bacterium]
MSQEILDHLSNADAVLAQLIRVVGPRSLEPPGECHPFETLARAIAHQQLNGIAANTILKRLTDSCGQGAFPTPQMILAATEASLRAAGFSFAKIAALRDLAGKTLADVVPHATALQQLTDEEIIARLTQVRGIGRWTVEMLLMFHLDRPDVLPVDDFGIRSGFRAAYGLRRLPKPKALAAWGERWKPYRTTAAWYLWRALELERAGTLPPPAERIRLPRVRPARRRSAGKARRGPAADRLKRAAASSARLRRADARTGARRPRARRSRAPASKK